MPTSGPFESPVARGFSAMAADYVDTTPQALRLVALADLRPGERVLDAGCGPGTVTVAAADRVGPEGRVIGVDLAEAMLARARAAVAGRTNVEIRAMDVTALDLPDGSIDAVVANSVLQFSGPASLPEWRRVTRPGGRVACSVPWGPEVWTTLCRRHVQAVAEPERSALRAQLDRAARRPDPERVRARYGFAAVTTDAETLVARFDSPEAAWASLWSHGARIFLEALPDPARDAFRDEFVAHAAVDGGAELRSEFLYWCFTVP
jgi:O-methyltransferase / aklanonic acid methyltransferase